MTEALSFCRGAGVLVAVMVAAHLHAGVAFAQSEASPASTGAMARAHLARAVGPEGLAGALLSSGLAQVTRSPEAWKQDAGGFGRRYASSLATGAVDEGAEIERLVIG